MNYEIVCDASDADRWHEERRKGIGGSDAPSLLGLTSWDSPTSLQVEKWGLGEDREETEQMKWGNRLEPSIIAGLAEDMGVKVEPFGKLIRSKSHPFMQCTPDGTVFGGTFVQIKNTMLAGDWTEEVPRRVWVQVQHEMAVSGGSFCMVAALIMGNRLVWQEVQRSDQFIDEVLIPTEQQFWELTQNHEPWPLDGSEATKRAIAQLFPEDDGSRVALDGRFLDLDEERQSIKRVEKSTKARLSEIDNEIRMAIAGASFGVLPNGVEFSNKLQHRKETTMPATDFKVLRRKEPKR